MATVCQLHRVQQSGLPLLNLNLQTIIPAQIAQENDRSSCQIRYADINASIKQPRVIQKSKSERLPMNMTALYLPVSESLESLESLLSESDELLLLALSLAAADTLALADDVLHNECPVHHTSANQHH